MRRPLEGYGDSLTVANGYLLTSKGRDWQMKLEKLEYKNGNVAYRFFCPGCKMDHTYYVKGRDVPNWKFNGNMQNPTFVPSLRVRHGKGQLCHLFMTDGKLNFLNDCTHELKGKTVDIPDLID